jgi:hypothetical protein
MELLYVPGSSELARLGVFAGLQINQRGFNIELN